MATSPFDGFGTAFVDGGYLTADTTRYAASAPTVAIANVPAYLTVDGEIKDLDDTGLVSIRPVLTVRTADGWGEGDKATTRDGRNWRVLSILEQRADGLTRLVVQELTA